MVAQRVVLTCALTGCGIANAIIAIIANVTLKRELLQSRQYANIAKRFNDIFLTFSNFGSWDEFIGWSAVI